jgi:beta-aspartyl-dipeptidase (metallo-type)
MILFRNARIYAPHDLGVCDVLVGGAKILAIQPKLPANTGLPIGEIDCDGLLLIPGLIDAHTHLAGGGGEGGARTRVPAVPLSRFTMAGVTTAIGLLGTDCTTRSIGELLSCVRGLSELGFNALCYTGGYSVPPPTLTGSVRGDIVHVDRIVAIGEIAISDHRSSQPTYDEIIRLAADAHVAGLMTEKAGLLHLHVGDGARGLDFVRRALAETELPARTFHPTHLNRNPSLWAEALASQAFPCDVTAFPPDDDDILAGRCIYEWWERQNDMRRLTVSSDGGGCLPTFNSDGELVAMDVGSSHWLLPAVVAATELGVPLADALSTVTSNVAQLFRLRGKGRVAVGADADLVVTTPDLTPIHTLSAGKFMVRDRKAVVTGLFE